MTNEPDPAAAATRREFLRASTATAMLAAGALVPRGLAAAAHAAGSDEVKVGLIGCGGRGSGALHNLVAAAPGVVVHALGDVFPERVETCREGVGRALGAAFRVDASRVFTGFDAWRGVIASGVDVVALATPPHFRPEHLEAAVAAGKHVFCEKPVAVDAAGVRRVLAAADEAARRGTSIVAGTQRRSDPGYREVLKRVRDGAIGELVGAQCTWNQGALWSHPRRPEWSDMEWQLRNWLYFTWLSGDHVVEQHVHNLDVLNWAFGGPPARAVGMGGRQARTDPAFGNVYDHFAVVLEYERGGGVPPVRAYSFCRQIDGCANEIGERLVGTAGRSDAASRIETHGGEVVYEYEGPFEDPFVQEQRELIAAIRTGTPRNDGRQVAEATMTAILCRMSAYAGRAVDWAEGLATEAALGPAEYAFGDLAVEPVAIPGSGA